MAEIIRQRMSADIEGDFVIFLIGMRINRYFCPDQWVPAFLAMLRMLRGLSRQEDLGLLGFRLRPGIRNHEVMQYWRSFEHLHTYARKETARTSTSKHLPLLRRLAPNSKIF